MKIWLRVDDIEAEIGDPRQRYSPDVAADWARLLAELVITQRAAELVIEGVNGD